jgi:hypothetical protein
MRVLRTFGIAGALLMAACSGTGTGSSDSAATVEAAAAQVCVPGQPDPHVCDPAQTDKTTICHIPPGNPANAHTLCVGTPAVDAHLAHGDRLGSCCDDGTAGNPTDPPPPTDTPPATPPPPSSPPPTDTAPIT